MDAQIRTKLLGVIDEVLGIEKRPDEFDLEEYRCLYNESHSLPIKRRTANDHLIRLVDAGVLKCRMLYSRINVYSFVDNSQDT